MQCWIGNVTNTLRKVLNRFIYIIVVAGLFCVGFSGGAFDRRKDLALGGKASKSA
jgi:hypothetical protein